MPLVRTKSSQKLASQEGRILLALDDIENSRIKSIRAVAKVYDCYGVWIVGQRTC